MALVAFDGFDQYGTAGTDLLNRRAGGFQWNAEDSGAVTFVSPGRNGRGTSIQMSGGSLSGALTTSLTTGIIGLAFQVSAYVAGSPYVYQPMIRFIDAVGATTVQLSVVFNCLNGGFDIWRGDATDGGGGVLLGSSYNNAFTLGAWNFFEAKVTIGASTGGVVLRCNGQTVYTLTGANTQDSAHASFSVLSLIGGTAGEATTTWDDFYAADTTTGAGTFPFNDFAGDVTAITLLPIGAGASTQWTPHALTNWQEVAQAHNDGDTSYNSAATAGLKDLFTFAALAGTIDNVLAVQVVGSYRKDNAGTHTIAQHLVSGSTEAVGATISIPTTYVYVYDLWTTDPNTGASWTAGAVNALQAGYVRVA